MLLTLESLFSLQFNIPQSRKLSKISSNIFKHSRTLLQQFWTQPALIVGDSIRTATVFHRETLHVYTMCAIIRSNIELDTRNLTGKSVETSIMFTHASQHQICRKTISANCHTIPPWKKAKLNESKVSKRHNNKPIFSHTKPRRMPTPTSHEIERRNQADKTPNNEL